MKKTFKVVVSTIVAIALILVPMTVSAESDYVTSKTKLSEGTNDYVVDTSVSYTVYILNPTDVGEFTITTEDGLIGIVSYLDMWVQFEPTDDIVNLNTIEWKCTDKNQSIMIAIKSDLEAASISITRKPLDTSNEIEWTIYENKTKPEKFTFPEFVDVDAFNDGYVDFEDSYIDDAVLGDDGFYHLNEKNGPVLFVNLNDSIMSIYEMSGYGRVAAIYYDDAGNVEKKVDYTEAFNQYVAALSTNSSGVIESYYYPLTNDLIEIFKEIGTTHDWYDGNDAWVYNSDDAWMFACYYDEDVVSMNPDENDINKDDTNNDTNIDDSANTEDNNTNNDINNNITNDQNTDTDDKSPETDDNALFVLVSILAVLVLFLNKKIILFQ